ncbi:myotubularin-related protein 4 isoform X3 [Myripristis murdjan]|uniref:myotubularin-related protein 4 isoform X3 n=1 Tax=Myripristis murdjan TaxID=586833 RepID=UPI0011762C43|nr:myotubularin-related protein 4 isoform X3 [Myripristis murdjan]XP_029924411.1 myotubularin-related protein 4 isoform X3 [Myripristis murdjan]XP_029924412.1 myotubularin-related protein 4 isoform X3 [Myripristis murdjan]
MGEEGPPSLEYIKAKDLFPQKELVKEDESLQVPFPALQGEGVEYLGRADDAIIAISNYRLHIKFKDSVINTYPGVDNEISVPLRLIESVEGRDMFQLHIICKDSKVVRCHFATFKQCQEWVKRLNRAIAHPSRLEDLFALAYHAWCLGGSADDEDQHVHLCRPGDHVRQRMEMEVKRMGFDTQNAWRVSDINSNFKLCSSYPQKLLVPVWITDKELESVASFRSWKRIPVVVYRHQRNGAVIARCSQPEISWWGWRNTEDEYLVTSIAKACQMDPGTKGTCAAPACRPRGEGPDSSDSDFDSSLTGAPGSDDSTVPQKLLILDARSYTAAVANRAKGGGCECEEYYPNCEVMFMGMANIHAIRNSFQALRAVCSQIPDPGNWLSALESTRWLQHLSVMLKAATLVCSAVERDGRPVLVHCSDGWDRTPQIVALSKILLDPFYRTLEGFQVLVETEWLDYGHKFGDRCGHQENSDDVSEQCPVFLQWLDCVHQLLKQFPCLFEFNEAFLVKLVQHTYSCLYGTFLCNNAREREARNIYKRTCSVWSLLRTGNKNFQNFLYIPSHDMVLQPVCHTRALQLWTAVYLPTSSPCTAVDDAMELYLPPSVAGDELTSRSLDRLPKTRSMDNLVLACENGVPLTRTSSDPNLNKHCQEGRSALEPTPTMGGTVADNPDEDVPSIGLHNGESEVEAVIQCPALTQEADSGVEGCEETLEETCLTTQPLPSLPLPPVPLSNDVTLPHSPFTTPILHQALPQKTNPPLPPPPPPLEAEIPCRTAETVVSPTHKSEACLPLPCNGTLPVANTPPRLLNGHIDGQENSHQASAELLALKQLTPLLPMEDSTETLTDEGELPPVQPSSESKDFSQNHFHEEEQSESQPQVQPQKEKEIRIDVVKGRECALALAAAPIPVDCTQVTARHLISQSQLSDLSLFGSHWESVQGLVQSACSSASHCGISRALQPNSYQSRRLASKLLRAQGLAIANGAQCCHREAVRCPSSPVLPGWLSAMKSAGYTALCGPTAAALNSYSMAGHQLLPASHSSPSASSSPPPSQTPAYLDDDGLPVPMDAVQQRLRQIEAGYKQEVEVLRQQVRQLQMRLESKHYGTPPSEPDIDYEDDITCLRESDNSNEEDSLSTHSEDRLSEGSWDRVERKDTEVTRWVPDHMASHCFNCDCEFWMAKRRHHCRNCGNVFCKDCCHLKLPIPDQQLYDPVLVCNACHDLLLESRTREIRSQQLKKPIATASS